MSAQKPDQEQIIDRKIALELSLNEGAVRAARALFAGNATVPFVARYRREQTGDMDELQLRQIIQREQELRELEKRRTYILKTLKADGNLSPKLRDKLQLTWDPKELEDLYAPFKKGRKTRGDRAREAGLEELAHAVISTPDRTVSELLDELSPSQMARGEALQGVKDILSEQLAHDIELRRELRELFARQGALRSKRKNTDADTRFADYFDWREPASKAPSHRVLAVLRGSAENALTISLRPPDPGAVRKVLNALCRWGSAAGRSGAMEQDGTAGRGALDRERERLFTEIAEDAWKRLLAPSLEREAIGDIRDRAYTRSTVIFQKNLEALLLAPPFGARPVLAIDPGLKTGCKVACIGAAGEVLETAQIFPLPPKRDEAVAARTIVRMCQTHGITAIAVGNGTGGRETEEFVVRCVGEHSERTGGMNIAVVAVDESGASVYSTSEAAREEFPYLDMYYRSAVSIGRRLQDPLAELVKIDPSSIGVGQYQHDIPDRMLRDALSATVESCVNRVGVDINTAGVALLSRVAGLSKTNAGEIVTYREQHGLFTKREDIASVPGIGPRTVEQAVGFLRCPASENPLENTGIHPERYDIVEHIANDLLVPAKELVGNGDLLKSITPDRYVDPERGIGMPTITDLLFDLAHPGRDPRMRFEAAGFSKDVHTFEDVAEGMVLAGVVRNVTAFGAFVDIGVHHDGLVHVSEMADTYVTEPAEVVSPGMNVTVRVIKIDEGRRRIGLSMKNL